jgi:phosphate:Na+ symporter
VFGYADQPTMMLALFHTLFNVLGIVLMTPLEPAMSRFLMTRFVERETRGVQLRYLDRNVAAVPDAAPAAICREFETLFSDYPQAMAGLPVATAARQAASVERQQHLDAIGDFFVEASRYPVSDQASAQMSMGWRIQHNLVYAEETLQRLNTLGNELQRMPDYEATRDMLTPWFDQVAEQLGNILAGSQGVLEFVELAPAYDKVKRTLLQSALAGHISRASLDTGLQMCSLSRRLAEQWLRALGHLRAMQAETAVSPPSSSSSPDAAMPVQDEPVQDNLASNNLGRDSEIQDGSSKQQGSDTLS